MGKRSDRRKFRRRRRWAGFLLLVSLGLIVFGAQFLVGDRFPRRATGRLPHRREGRRARG